MKSVRPRGFGAPSGDDESGAVGVSRGWMALGLSRAECLEICAGSFGAQPANAEVVTSCVDLGGAGTDVIAIISPAVAELFPQSAAALFRDIPWRDSWVSILLPWQEPPTRSIRADGTAQPFCCSARVFSELLKSSPADQSELLCFRLLDAILNQRVEVGRLLVRQLPLRTYPEPAVSFPKNAALMRAHRGPQHFLVSALRSITAAAFHAPVTVRVGLDAEDVIEYRDVAEAFPLAEFYSVGGTPVGPYVIRQGLIDLSSEELIVFHDSDDVSCYDRMARQAAEIAEQHVDIVGSHESRVDELAETVEVHRFPVDASAALALPGSTQENDRAHEPLLHPTLTMVRSGFAQAGGFSTDRKIANDTQFMLRAYFSLRMRNVDDFLYIRRRHAVALTVLKETALGTPLRHFLGMTWGADFEAVKTGNARLEKTSLWPRQSAVPHPLIRLWESGGDSVGRSA